MKFMRMMHSQLAEEASAQEVGCRRVAQKLKSNVAIESAASYVLELSLERATR